MATYDGDTVPIAVTNMTGFSLPPGGRVYVLIIPPSGNFIVGFAGEMQQLSRGQVDWVASTVSSAAIGAEAVVLTGNSITWAAGRAYEVINNPYATGDTASSSVVFRIRKTNLAGTDLHDSVVTNSPNIGNGTSGLLRRIIRNNTSADVTANIVLTMNAAVGTAIDNGGALSVRYLETRDIGAAADYSDAAQI